MKPQNMQPRGTTMLSTWFEIHARRINHALLFTACRPRLTLCSRFVLAMVVLVTAARICQAQQNELPSGPELDIPLQPFLAQIHRVTEAMEVVGTPLPSETVEALQRSKDLEDDAEVVSEIQRLLDPLCLACVDVQESGPPVVIAGNSKRELMEQGWRTFLVKVINRPGRNGRLLIESPNAESIPHAMADQVESRWMQLSAFDGQPLLPNLSGLGIEYRIVQIYSRDAGAKSGVIEFYVSGDSSGERDLIEEWRFFDGTDGWYPMNQVELVAENNALQVTSLGEDPFIGTEVVQDASGAMLLRFWAKSDVDGIGQFYWWTQERDQPTPDRQANFLLESGREHLYEIPFYVDGKLAGIRLDPMIRSGQMRIDWIDLFSAQRSSNWAGLTLDFESMAATPVTLRIIDQDGIPAFARFEIQDTAGRVYPSQSKRLAPDFFFQKHIYRGDGERVLLPPGIYSIQCSRGPETIPERKQVRVEAEPREVVYRVNRWVDPSQFGWWSGDHHIHAAGCLHYENPTQGVAPNDMIRHIMGEDLKVGCCLTWGPCFDFQKRFFTGETAEQSQYPYTLRYDVEVSGFGSHNSGHLNLLNLKEQIYPGGDSKDHWPTLGLNTLRWAKAQGGICGPAHSAIGLTRTIGRIPGTEGKEGSNRLPNFEIPAFDGIGANEFIVDVTHQVPNEHGDLVPAVDFISTMDTERVAEWNMWYHVLNCGFRVVASGETDFPCISGERVGMGRVYAKVDNALTFEAWVQAVANGRSYVSDGFCHLIDFRARPSSSAEWQHVGVDGSQIDLASEQSIQFSVDCAARIEAENGAGTNEPILVELIVNGYPVQSVELAADQQLRNVRFDHVIRESSWVAVRVFPHAHSNPIFVEVDHRPVLANLHSARWCLAGVEQCWKSKQPTYAAGEQRDAIAAFDHARKTYQEIVSQIESRLERKD